MDESQQMPVLWWQDLVGWGSEMLNRAREQEWINETTSVQTYPELHSDRAWRVVSTITPRPICGLSHAERGGRCVMPPGHMETPHVWTRPCDGDPGAHIVSLTMVRELADA